jgi:hypothetical protein
MSGSYFLLPALIALLFSFLVVRAGAIALMMTGVEREKAKFQSLSAFTGTGFTTRETETVVNHPARRRIITWLIIVGNAGIIAVIVSATSSLVTSRGVQIPMNGLILVVGAVAVFWLATRGGFIRRWDMFIENRLVRSRALEEAPAEDLLHFLEGYGLVRGIVSPACDLIGSSLAALRLPEQGVLVLGIERKGHWIPIPRSDETIAEGDRLVAYGPLTRLREMFGEA